MKKYKDHPSIIAIKRKVKMGRTFEFRFVTLLNVMNKIETLETKKPSSDSLSTKIIQEAKEAICPYLTDSLTVSFRRNQKRQKYVQYIRRGMHVK